MDELIRFEFETEQKYEIRLGDDYAVSCAPATAFHIVPYEPWHLRAISLQPHQEHLGAYLQATGFADHVTASGPCWTALSGARPIACGGFIKHWVGRSGTWAALSDDAGRHMLALTRAVRRGLVDHPAERIEATVLVGFEPGMRWARALGFEEEGLLRRYQRGADHVAFVLLKPPAPDR